MTDVVCWRGLRLLRDLGRDLYNALPEEALIELSYIPDFSVFFVRVCMV